MSPGLLFRLLAVTGIVFALAYQIHAQTDPVQQDVPSPTPTNTDQAPTASIDTSISPTLSASPADDIDTSISPTLSPGSSASDQNVPTPSDENVPTQSSQSATISTRVLLYSAAEFNGSAFIHQLPLSDTTTSVTGDFQNGTFWNFAKELFLSPDRQLIAITIEQVGSDAEPLTYISRINGEQVTTAHPGSFVSWAPDSSRVLVYRSDIDSESGRRIYYLDLNDAYSDSGLPDGVISADISPIDGTIVYAVAAGVTDNTDVYRRDPSGTDTLLRKGQDNVFAWLHFSPDAKKVAFMKGNLYNQPEDQSLWVMNPDGTGTVKISDITWNYPPYGPLIVLVFYS